MTTQLHDKKGFITDDVSTVKAIEANTNENNRIKFVTELAAVSRGKTESAKPYKRYTALLEEAASDIINIKCNICGTEQAVSPHPKVMTSPCSNCGSEEVVYDIIRHNNPSRPLEFLPIVFGYRIKDNIIILTTPKGERLPSCEVDYCVEITKFINGLGKFSYMKDGILYTNMRAVLISGIPYECVPYCDNEDKEYYRTFVAIRAKIPMFIWAQVPNTHTAISKEAQSDRIVTENEYWLPKKFRAKIKELHTQKLDGKLEVEDWIFKIMDKVLTSNNLDTIIELFIKGDYENNIVLSQNDVQTFFKFIGYPKEIYSRAIYYFKYKEVVMTGWNIDPKVWQHLLLERSYYPKIHKNWTQKDTADFVKLLGEIINQNKYSIGNFK